MKDKCPNDVAGLELRCHAGYLWELTYGDSGPPGNRQNTGKRCPHCNPRTRNKLTDKKDD